MIFLHLWRRQRPNGTDFCVMAKFLFDKLGTVKNFNWEQYFQVGNSIPSWKQYSQIRNKYFQGWNSISKLGTVFLCREQYSHVGISITKLKTVFPSWEQYFQAGNNIPKLGTERIVARCAKNILSPKITGHPLPFPSV